MHNGIRNMMDPMSLASLPNEILITLPGYLRNIEDYTNLSSTCRTLRACLAAASPNTILRLAFAQSTTFFRPSPHYLVAATARELGDWARLCDANEAALATSAQESVDGIMELSLQHCGLTMERIRHLHLTQFSIVNPLTDIIDKCVGQQWYATDNFWNGGVSDAYTIDSDPAESFFHLALYGELFGADFEPLLNGDTHTRRLSVATRLEIVKYCIPDFAVQCDRNSEDPRRMWKATGPYRETMPRSHPGQHNLALTWLLRSSRWRPHWRAVRSRVGEEFQSESVELPWWSNGDDDVDWRQRMWEAVMVSQGWEGLGMIRDGSQEEWVEKVKEWREKIEQLPREPATVTVGRQTTREYPFLLGDLRILASGYVPGT